MTAHEQTDLFGGSVPLEELDLAGHSRRLAQAERERGHALSAVEAGQLIHAARGKHAIDQVCQWCGEDGTQALVTLATHRGRLAERERQRAEDPPWTCVDCGHLNPPDAVFCRSCASTQQDDREPTVTLDPTSTSSEDPEPHVTGLQPATPDAGDPPCA